ncbi:MAG: hypothetical protein KGI28_07795 [Thaumarchaeota archaeon]|nr:hypothetical protein [Nitrososphaerota archaeon]
MSDPVRPYDFYFTITWWGNPFNGVHLEFNCNISIEKVLRGTNEASDNLGHGTAGSGTNIIDINFPLATIQDEGITIYVHSDSSVLPRITKVVLNLPSGGGTFPYSDSQVQQLNENFFPKKIIQ